jgi:kanamycin kinase
VEPPGGAEGRRAGQGRDLLTGAATAPGARIIPRYSGSGRLRLSRAATTCRATALSVVSHPVAVERPHRPNRALPGQAAVARRWKAAPQIAVAAIGRGLRALHDALPARDCPFSASASQRLAGARRRARQGLVDPARWHREHQHLSVARALRLLSAIPPVDQLVVCHGDSCTPNTLLTGDGRWSGHVDLGALGVADRWADLAIATWSATWNYGPGWEPLLLSTYGVSPDPDRTRYYRLLYDLDP